jgi:multiple sugar transport system ATP-binding protein
MTLGDRVAVMKDGVLQQCDTPRALYERPANAFVAGFIGSPPMNLVEGTVDPGGVKLGSVVIPVSEQLPKAVGEKVTVGLRPESLALTSPGSGVPAVISIVEELGAEAFVYAELVNGADHGSDTKRSIIARVEPNQTLGGGELIHLGVKDGSLLFFDAETGAAIRT